MRRRTSILALSIAVIALAAVAIPAAGAGVQSQIADSAHQEATGGEQLAQNKYIQDCAAEPPVNYADPDEPNGTIGWTEGYWYNEPLNLDTSDGLNESELEKLGARTTARYEAMRCLDAVDGTPPIEIQTRDEFKDNQGDLFADLTTKDELYANSQYETMLMVGSEEDYWEVREANRGESAGGFYSFAEERIVMVSDDPDSLLIEEYVLAQEVGHAIQDQQFNLSRYERPTNDIDKGVLGLIEGDANLIDSRYQEACQQGLWEEPCVNESSSEGGGGGGELASWGLYLNGFQPYSDGPGFIEFIYEQQGFEGINELYDNPPQSAMYIAYPDRLGEVELADVEIEDASNDNWERLTYENSTDYDTVGIAGIAAMFMAPAYETEEQVWSPQDFLNIDDSGNVDSSDPLIYEHPETEGWRGDKLYVYSNEANETATVWELAWADAEAKEPFLDSYQQLIDIYSGERVDGYEYTYRFGDDSKFDMVLTIVPEGDTVTIVKAPSVDALTGVHDVELVESESADGSDDEDDTSDGQDDTDDSSDDSDTTDSTNSDSTGDGDGTDDGDETDSDGDGMDDGDETDSDGDGMDDGESTDNNMDDDEESDDGSGPGFGVLAGALAVLLGGLLVARRT